MLDERNTQAASLIDMVKSPEIRDVSLESVFQSPLGHSITPWASGGQARSARWM
jgi:hypothetical protein